MPNIGRPNLGALPALSLDCEPPCNLHEDVAGETNNAMHQTARYWMFEAYRRAEWTREEIAWVRAASDRSMAEFCKALGLPPDTGKMEVPPDGKTP